MHRLSSVSTAVRSARFLPENVFKFGSLRTRLRTDDTEFRVRFLRMFHDCLDTPAARSSGPLVNVDVIASAAPDPVIVQVSRHDTSSALAILASLFPELALVPMDTRIGDGWQLFASDSARGHAIVATFGNYVVFDRAIPWQIVVAHYLLTHVMRLQPQVAFFHSASVALGECGMLLSGEKGSGKSTLSLALAARGHDLLGDETAAVDSRTGTILPFRRAVSIRAGPQAQAVRRFLTQNSVDPERLSDGSDRWRLPVSSMFANSKARSVQLTHALFLCPMSDKPWTRPFTFSWKDLPLIAPLHTECMSTSAAERTLTLLKLFGQVRCYKVSPGGSPDETAEIIEKIVEGTWAIASRKKPNRSAPFAG